MEIHEARAEGDQVSSVDAVGPVMDRPNRRDATIEARNLIGRSEGFERQSPLRPSRDVSSTANRNRSRKSTSASAYLVPGVPVTVIQTPIPMSADAITNRCEMDSPSKAAARSAVSAGTMSCKSAARQAASEGSTAYHSV